MNFITFDQTTNSLLPRFASWPILLTFFLLPLQASEAEGTPADPTQAKDPSTPEAEIKATAPSSTEPTSADGAGWSFSTETAQTARSRTRLGSRHLGEVSSETASINVAKTFRLAPPLALQLGLSAQNTHFSGSSAATRLLPQDLSSITLSLGTSYDWNNQWTIGAQFAPGIYSDFRDLRLSDVNVSALIGATYLVNPKLSWKFGLALDLWNKDIPVLPFIGVEWHFADHWTLRVDVLTPRLEWEINPAVTLFTAVSYQGSTYRVSRDFDRRSGLARTGNDLISFTETRVGGGLVWRVIPAVQVEVQGGLMVEREVEYQNADKRLRSRPSPYFQLGVSAGF